MDHEASAGAARSKRLSDWVEAYGDGVLRTCFVMLLDRGMAEDAMQDTFLKAWRHMQQFEGRSGCSAKTWLQRIAINTCKDYRRTAWFRRVDRRQSLEQLPPALQPVSAEDRALFLDILDLPEPLRQAVLLYYYQQLTLEEAAQALSIHPSTVFRRLEKARALLRKGLEGAEET